MCFHLVRIAIADYPDPEKLQITLIKLVIGHRLSQSDTGLAGILDSCIDVKLLAVKTWHS